jgi:hypothetical protein
MIRRRFQTTAFVRPGIPPRIVEQHRAVASVPLSRQCQGVGQLGCGSIQLPEQNNKPERDDGRHHN